MLQNGDYSLSEFACKQKKNVRITYESDVGKNMGDELIQFGKRMKYCVCPVEYDKKKNYSNKSFAEQTH